VTLGAEDTFAAGSASSRMLRIAAPLSLAALFRYGVELSNTYWVGRLGVAQLSIATALGTFLTVSTMFAGLTSAGTSAVIGRMLGERRMQDALGVAQKVTAVSLLLGAAVALTCAALSHRALDALHFHGATRTSAARYLFVVLLGLPAAFGLMTVQGALVGLGKVRTSIVASGASLVVGFAATPIFLRVVGTGVWGSAVAQVVGDTMGYAVGALALSRLARERRSVVAWRDRFKGLRDLFPLFRIGAPMTFEAVVHGAVWFALASFMSRFGTSYLAAQGAEERLAQLLNVGTAGVAPATATLVGFELGAGRRSSAVRIVFIGLAVVGVEAAFGVVLLRAAPGAVAAWFCDDPAFVRVAAQVLGVSALGLAFLGGRDVLEAAFGGTGSAMPPVVAGLFVAVVRIPLAYVLAVRLGRGGLGVPWAVNVTLVVQVLALLVWFLVRFRPRPASAVSPGSPVGAVPDSRALSEVHT
jgi:putative MATE family efflux protein